MSQLLTVRVILLVNAVLCCPVTGNDVLDITEVRLVNGNGIHDGRVEININGVWGTICDDSFGISAAQVVCRMLNLTASAIATKATFGEGNGPIFAQKVTCSGSEPHLRQCTYVTSGTCSHGQDVGVFCTECGHVNITYGEGYSLSPNGSVLTVSCYKGFRSNVNTTVCDNNIWSLRSIECVPDSIVYVRLQDGVGLYDGRIEVLINGTWGAVCRNTLTYKDVQTICTILFGTRNYQTYYPMATAGAVPVLIKQLGCTGYENNINECEFSTDAACSNELSAAGVVCRVHPLNITDIRLADGNGPFDGRVELYVDGNWGTICRRYIGLYDAMTLCNMLNLSLAAYFKNNVYGEGSGPVLIQNLRCDNEENQIASCNYYDYPSEISPCNHNYDLSLVCTPCGSPNVINGEATSFNGSVLTVTCQTGSIPYNVYMTCLENGTWAWEEECTPVYVYPLNITDIRLAGNNWPSEGRVEILVNGTWGTICGRNVNEIDVDVICRMFGLTYQSHYTKAKEENLFGIGTGPIYIDDIKCNGTENHINWCNYDLSNSCTHFDDLAVICTGYQLNITGIRLAGTNGPYHGRVEIQVNSTWGTISDFGFYQLEAHAVCSMLGLKYKEYIHNSHYGKGQGPNYINNLDCKGYYSHINDCKYVVDDIYNQDHSDDASVICYGPELNITGYRLTDGTGVFDGRAEIKVNDTWGTICDNNFNILAADLFCKQFGLRAVQYFTGAEYGEGSGPIYIDQIFCQLYNQDFSNCKYLYLNSCTHEMDISLVCNECGEPAISFWGAGYFRFSGSTLYSDCSFYRNYIGTLNMTCDTDTKTWVTRGECQEYNYPLEVTDIRLVNGSRPSNGRVELKSLGTWGTICDHSFGILEANTICNMVGYPHAVTFFPGSHNGDGSGPIFVDDLVCGDNSTHINNCTYKTYDDCDHSHDVFVECTDCGDPAPGNGFVNSTRTSYGTAIHITCKQNYELVGEADIICQLNGSWNSLPECNLIDCGDPTPEHGSSNDTVTIKGTVVRIWCDEGYNISGDVVIICRPDRLWTGYPTCEIIDCGTPKPDNASVSLPEGKTTYGNSAIISCLEGYNPLGSTPVSCLANGSWEVWPKCKAEDCGDPSPNKGSANTTETTYGTVVEITCSSGFNLSGNSTIVCQSDGTWSDNPVCDTSDCGPLSVANGDVDQSDGTSLQSIVTITCNEGFDIQGPSAVVCTRSGWNDSTTCVLQVCENPSPTNGRISDTDGKDGYVFGNYANIDCNTGYSIQGENVITCQNGGVWSDRPVCELVDCGNLTTPTHGTKKVLQGTKYNDKITFNCNEGFLLVGEETIICGKTGEWSNEAPICLAKSIVGGPCVSNEYCLMKDSLCINSVCTCITGIYENRTNTCDKMPLLPYGSDVGDYFLSEEDICGPGVTFLPGMPVSGKMRTNLYVCSYGFISLDTRYTNPSPPQNIDDVLTVGQHTIIAPFYGPINRRRSGPVYYRSYDILNSYNKMKDDAELVSYIENIVIKFGDLETYDASFILIATWHNTRPFGIGFDTSKTSTFQAVLVSDGKTTYVFYIYGHGLMQWNINDSHHSPIWVGFKTDTVDSFTTYTHPYAFSSQVLQLDSLPVISKSKNDVTGLVFKQLSQNGRENDAVDCIRWYNENHKEKQHLDYISSLTPECPCDIWLSRFDPWFWRIGLHRWRKDVTHACVDMLHVGNFGQYGKSCCYDLRTWLWVYERPLAGGFQLYSPQYPLEHIQNDVIPKTKCCVNSDYCNLYYELRPTGSCYVSSSYDYGVFWGDPHFITLDGLNFTFNGLGEFTLLQIRTANYTFDLQARTERAIKKDGNLSDATVFSVFAVKDSTNASLQVELNRAKDGMILHGNKIDLTKQFYASVEPYDPIVYFPTDPREGNLIIFKQDETISVSFPTMGITLNISVNVEMLSLNTGVSKSLKGHTTGLLGNYDGNPDNDFSMPSGTVLRADLTEREVFEYGKSWEINPDNSAFIYDEGKSHSNYHNNSYVPRFLDEADPVKRAEAEKSCNGSHNIECVFDFVFTEKKEIADQTNIIRAQSDSTRSELEIMVPSLTGCMVVNAKKGDDVICNLNYDTGDEIHFIENSVNAMLDQGSSSIKYVQTTDEPVNIRIASKNEHGRYSPTFIVSVLLCTNCNGHGVCTNQSRDDARENNYFKYATCECEPQYQGNDCEEDFDGCAANPCSLKRNCTTLTAEEQKAQKRSFICGPCPSGYRADNEGDCIDLDECIESMNVCEHVCVNTEGSYFCSCNAGFRVDSRNISNCRDINECEQAQHNCTHVCSNTAGGFSCTCYSGYKLDEATWSCVEVSDGGCNETERFTCSNTSGCTIVEGRSECFCTEGYELDESKTLCQDIDECSRDVCPHDCVNSAGSFQCVCFTGYKLQEPTTCIACEIPYWGNNCTHKCVCTGRGADRCDTVKGCKCEDGWQGETCDDDINECSTLPEVCDDPRKTCVNYLGSYSCVCKTGFHLTEQGDCEDDDECADPQLHNCMHKCKNAFGGYTCECYNGFSKVNATSCADVNECAVGTDRCEQQCTNYQGLYTCSCFYGYILNDDRQTCTKVSDPCFTERNLTCSHFCVLSQEEAACGCQKGYHLESDNETCTDINECDDSATNKCDNDATCINTVGSLTCVCPVGKQLENDDRTCSDCDMFHYGKDCLQNCSCLYGKCDRIAGCVSDGGWAGNQCDIDINECETGLVTCTADNTVCTNLLGGAMCSCSSGYTNNSGVCRDIDECSDVNLNSCDQQCTNSVGSYTCTCNKGFVLKGGKCTDVDECSGKNACDQICENVIGSYICSCAGGFKLNLIDRKSCRPENECNDKERTTCKPNTACSVKDGEVICTCLKGYRAIGNACEDVNECSTDTNPCSQNCTNIDGSFRCSCYTGYYLADDQLTCQKCNVWKYGKDCSANCSCNKLQAEKCDSVTGHCECRPEWTGAICGDDVDECTDETACPNNSICMNFAGGFECRCRNGYFTTGTGHCEECDNWHFGNSCLQDCTCSFENTDDCYHETGECICKQGWTGVNCTTYDDECTKDTDVCQEKANSFCQSNAGSFKCICKDGFLEENGHCKECDDSHYGTNCSKKCLCNSLHTAFCHHVTGKCTCKEGRSGVHCTDDIDECVTNGTVCQTKANSTCRNTDGSYECVCDDGFQEQDNICTVNWSLVIGLSGAGLFLVIMVALTVVGLRNISRRQKRKRSRSSQNTRRPYGQRSNYSNKQMRQEDETSTSELRHSNWREKFSSTPRLRPNENLTAYIQPYHIPHARAAAYSDADNNNQR
ncbi:uncharacterized protein LOC123533517 isoform X2 [Mercenaria mercenaria]|uniref:uncharacterized protein LOC123533517 isoform X2 n=1 Tax=Mercenaria mercenaria TaxID=6596 RepID=UPI00234F037A|nr:uncharacterized protein LOC123533517 isoform X2 [Mercenaria mercenaria]